MSTNNEGLPPSSHASANPTIANTMSSDANTTTTRSLSSSGGRDMAWEWGECRDINKKHIVWCKLCGHRMYGGITRLKQHLTHTGGQVIPCSKASPDIQKRVMASIKDKGKIQLEKKRNLQILREHSVNLDEIEDEEDQDDAQEVFMAKNVAKKKKFVGASNVRGPLDNVFKTDHEKTKQATLDRNNPIKEKLKMEAWDKFALWAYSVGLSFNAVRDEGFQDFIYAIGEYGKGMPAPSYHNIRVTLLKRCLEKTKEFVDSFRQHWEEYGCSIMSDFWTDGKGRCLINFLVNCPLGTIYLKSIDASEHVKNKDLIVGMINEVIEDVGEANIMQFITDNGSNFKAAGKILEEQHKKMFWTPCAAHCVNLMIQDIAEKIPKIKNTLANARAIVVFIYNHGRVLSMMRKLTKNRELHRSCVTRFATQFYTIQSVHENRHHIQVLFVSEEWRKSDFAKKAPGKRVERIVAKNEFWDNIQLSCQVLAPLVDVVRLVDTEEKPSIGYIHEAVKRMKEQINKNVTDQRLVTKILGMIQARWTDQLHHPLHAAGYYLNPVILNDPNWKDIKKSGSILTGLYIAIDRLVPNEAENDQVRLDLNQYMDSLNQFSSGAAKRARTKVAPYIWWRTYGIDTPLLQTFAIRVLSQTCSASPCERNWSAFDNLHTKKRNCLLQQKLNDLVYIQYNTRLERRFKSLQANKALDPILLRDVDENDDWVIPTENELREFADGRDGPLWSVLQEAMERNEDDGPNTRNKRSRYSDDDGDNEVEVEDLDQRMDGLIDVNSDEDFTAYD